MSSGYCRLYECRPTSSCRAYEAKGTVGDVRDDTTACIVLCGFVLVLNVFANRT